ncbi:MAG: hypothetical protein KGM16_16450 [Bacteroidota bacterium]|nr:hypothetical protein [Bacteroidota bacterium]
MELFGLWYAYSNFKGCPYGHQLGVDGDHEPQNTLPDGKDIAGYPFIKRSRKYLENYLHLDFDDINFNYTNLCFFRSPQQKDLNYHDYKVSLKLFKQFVDYIKPPWIFSLGDSNSKLLEELNVLDNKNELPNKDAKFRGITGELWGITYFSVPHPNARVKSELREEIWKCIGDEFNKRFRGNDFKK